MVTLHYMQCFTKFRPKLCLNAISFGGTELLRTASQYIIIHLFYVTPYFAFRCRQYLTQVLYVIYIIALYYLIIY